MAEGCLIGRARLKSTVLTALAVAGLAATVSACGGSTAGTLAPGARLRVGFSFPPDSADLAGQIALHRYGRDRRVAVTTQFLGGAPNTLSALLHGSVDLGSLNLPDAINAIAQGAKLHVILGSKMFPEYVFAARSGIATPSQLKGRRIGIQGPRSDALAFTQLLLAHSGLRLGAVQLLSIPQSPARVAALVRGRIDATALRYHEFLRAQAKIPGLRNLGEMHALEPARMTQVWVVTDEYRQRNARELQRLVSSMLTSYASTYSPTGRAAWLAAGAPDIFRGDPARMPAAVYAFYRRYGMWPRPNRPITAAGFARMLTQLQQGGQVSRGLPFRTVWDPSFWQRAAAGG